MTPRAGHSLLGVVLHMSGSMVESPDNFSVEDHLTIAHATNVVSRGVVESCGIAKMSPGVTVEEWEM